MVAPERRTRGDLIAAAAIVAVVAVVIAAFWWHSSARSTILIPAPSKATGLVTPQAVPDALHETWTAASSRTSVPVAVGGTVITGEGRDVVGHDPNTGEQRWRYARDIDLCAVTQVYDLAVAVYPDGRGCGQVTGIRAATGVRGPSRTSYSDRHTVVSSDGSAVLSYGPTRLELWRTDLVRMLSYGEIDSRVKPVNTGIGSGCTLMSAAGSDASAAVLEACRDEKDLRLTLLKPAKEEDEPDTKHVPMPGLAVDADARVLAVSGTRAAVYLPIPRPAVVVYDETGTKVSETPLRIPPALDGATPALTHAGDYFTWWTGTSVMVFDSTLSYRYTIDAPTLGPATMMAGRFLIPVADGLAVYNPANGSQERVIAVPHAPGDAVVIPSTIGPVVLEQRGATLTAFSP